MARSSLNKPKITQALADDYLWNKIHKSLHHNRYTLLHNGAEVIQEHHTCPDDDASWESRVLSLKCNRLIHQQYDIVSEKEYIRLQILAEKERKKRVYDD